MECQFTQNERFPPQAYEVALNTVGIDLASVQVACSLGWPANQQVHRPGRLAGEYVGATGEVGSARCRRQV